jgi:hypothetical protein
MLGRYLVELLQNRAALNPFSRDKAERARMILSLNPLLWPER